MMTIPARNPVDEMEGRALPETSAAEPATQPSAATPRASRPLQWRRAGRALRTLIADPERTDQVAELFVALGGPGDLRAFARFSAHRLGQRLLAERPSLPDVLRDLDRLAAMPVGSFGRTYADFMRTEHLDPDGIVAEFEAVDGAFQSITPTQRWFFARLDVVHDLWHVLTGYGRDEAGEAANLAFTLAQFPTRGAALLVAAAALLGPKDLRLTWQRYLYRAWRRGRRADLLTVIPYEALLPLPLDEVRALLHIEPAEDAHPQGVLVGNRSSMRAAAAGAPG